MRHWAGLWIGCWLIVSLLPVTAQRQFEAATCPFQPPLRQRVECGYVLVPENYEQPGTRQVRLALAILRHPRGAAYADPIIYLEGGPGGSALEYLQYTFAGRYAPLFAANRDIIVFDQRGVGLSQPALDCPAYDRLMIELLDFEEYSEMLTRLEVETRLRDSLMACGAALAAQYDLSQYHSAVSARDIEALRVALGYEQVNLWGISYGTRLALTMMHDYPDSLRSVLLDSTYPPEVDLFTDSPDSWVRALNTLFGACAADTACDSAYPDLRSTFLATVDSLNTHPARLTVINPRTGRLHDDVVLDGVTYLDVNIQLLYDSTIVPILPQMMTAASNGDTSAYSQAVGRLVAQQGVISLGMNHAVQCHEELPFTRRGTIQTAYAAHPELQAYLDYGLDVESIFDVCAAFAVGAAPLDANNGVVSAVPTLILAGRFDPITPPHWGQQVQRNLAHSTYIEFPTLGHGVTNGRECPQHIAAAFFIDPLVQPDTTCMETMDLHFSGTDSAPIDFIPVMLSNYGINATTIIPAGWQEQGELPGLFMRGSSTLDVTLVQFSKMPNIRSVDFVAQQVGQQFGTRRMALLQTVQGDYALWRIYPIRFQGNPGYAALTIYDGSAVVIVMLGTEREKETILVPMLEAFAPNQ